MKENLDKSDSDLLTDFTRVTLTGVLTQVTVDCAIFSGILDVIDSLPLSCADATEPTPESDSELLSVPSRSSSFFLCHSDQLPLFK